MKRTIEIVDTLVKRVEGAKVELRNLVEVCLAGIEGRRSADELFEMFQEQIEDIAWTHSDVPAHQLRDIFFVHAEILHDAAVKLGGAALDASLQEYRHRVLSYFFQAVLCFSLEDVAKQINEMVAARQGELKGTNLPTNQN
jgi:hypothetical protein